MIWLPVHETPKKKPHYEIIFTTNRPSSGSTNKRNTHTVVW
jgi:hypothetical protein